MKKPRGKGMHERVLAVRIPETLAAELDRCVERMRRETPWAQMTRSDAVRWILISALRKEQPFGGMFEGSGADGQTSAPPTEGSQATG